MSTLRDYYAKAAERLALGIPPLPLTAKETQECFDQLLGFESEYPVEQIVSLIRDRVPPGVDPAAYVKAANLSAVACGQKTYRGITALDATVMLGTMMGGYNVTPLIELLKSPNVEVAEAATHALSHTVLLYEAYDEIDAMAEAGQENAIRVRQALADAEWFTSRSAMAEQITVTVFKVAGETNTDDLSPATDATTRPDEPLHARAMLKNRQPGSLETIAELKKKGYSVAYVGNIIGTGSSRKSARNSAAWHFGGDIPFVPNSRSGFVTIGEEITPIYFSTLQDSGDIPIKGVDVNQLADGDVITIFPYQGRIVNEAGEQIDTFTMSPNTIFDDYRAGGRILKLIGQQLTNRARASLGLGRSELFAIPTQPEETNQGYTLAQKMVGKACGLTGVRPGSYCEPIMATVGSQDTTGPMTRDEVKGLACLGFSADLVMQSFCHTAAYPKPVDVRTHADLPDFMQSRGAINLRPGDGVIHSWLNRMLIPDTVGTGGDSHTRFPLGISFPAGSGLVALAAALGIMPLDMPESVRVRFTGKLQPGITLRDLVNAIPHVAIQRGLLTNPYAEVKKKINVFNGRILEIEGLPEDITVEQGFEFADASAERSAAACTVKLSEKSVEEYMVSCVALLKEMLIRGYGDGKAILRRIARMEEWLAKPLPRLMSADPDAVYAAEIEINMDEITQPIVAAPNHPDNVQRLEEAEGQTIEEVFIGSCMTNIAHYRLAMEVLMANVPQANVRTWIVPTTHLDEVRLRKEGYYNRIKVWANQHGIDVFDYTEFENLTAGELLLKAQERGCLAKLMAFITQKPKATLLEWVGIIANTYMLRFEKPGCSLCMGNQARVQSESSVFSTSTRNFNDRLGDGAQVYLGSAELAACCSLLGRIPSLLEYRRLMATIDSLKASLFQFLFFDREEGYGDEAAFQAKVAELQA